MYDTSTIEGNIYRVINEIKRRIFIDTAVAVQIAHVAGLGGIAGYALSYGHFEVGWNRGESRYRVSIAIDENIQSLASSYIERLVTEVKHHIRKYAMDCITPENTASYMTDNLRGIYEGNTNAYEGIEDFLPAKLNKKLLLV